MKKIKLVIVSEKTRYHFQKPLDYFENIEIVHLYKDHYPDMSILGFKTKMVQYKNIFDLYKKLKQSKPDLVQGMEPYYGYSRFKIPIKVIPILKTIYLFCKLNNVPYFYHKLENISPSKKYGPLASNIMKLFSRIYSRGASFIFYLNKGAKENLKILGVKPQKMISGLYGIWGLDLKQFKPANDYLQIKNNLLFVGRLIKQKGLTDVIEGLNMIPKDMNLTLTIVGDGLDRKYFKNLVAKLNLKNKISFVGQKNNKDLISYYQKADILLSPTRSLKYSAEQIGVVNLEAAACGLPVISTKSGSIGEYVIEGKTGFLVNERSPKQISEKIIYLYSNPKLIQKMAKNSLSLAKKKYNAQKNVHSLEKTILERYNEIRQGI